MTVDSQRQHLTWLIPQAYCPTLNPKKGWLICVELTIRSHTEDNKLRDAIAIQNSREKSYCCTCAPLPGIPYLSAVVMTFTQKGENQYKLANKHTEHDNTVCVNLCAATCVAVLMRACHLYTVL